MLQGTKTVFDGDYLDRTGICVWKLSHAERNMMVKRSQRKNREKQEQPHQRPTQCNTGPSLPSFPDAPLPCECLPRYLGIYTYVCAPLYVVLMYAPFESRTHNNAPFYTSTIFVLFASAISFSSLQLPQYSACHRVSASTLFSSMGRMTLCPSRPTLAALAVALPLLLLLAFSDSIILICSHRRFSSASQFSHSLWIISFSILFTTLIATSRSCRYDPSRWRVRRSCRAVALLVLELRTAPASSYVESSDVVFRIWRNVL